MGDRLQRAGLAAGRASRRTGVGSILLVVALLALGAQPAHAWRTTFDGAPVGLTTEDFWNAVAQDPSGDLFVAGVSALCQINVERLDGATGATVWRRSISECDSDETLAPSAGEVLLVDPAGDVIVGRRSLGGDRSFVVFKYAGASGDVLWSVRVGGFPKAGPFVHATALDAAGNVVVAAGLGAYAGCCTDLVVAKLDGSSGVELWRRTEHGSFVPNDYDDADSLSQATSVAVDPSGDVLAVGTVVDATSDPFKPNRRGMAMKLSGADGSELWRVDSPTTALYGGSSPLLVYPNGDLAHIGARFEVVKRSGATGAELWRYQLADLPGAYRTIGLLALATDGTVVATGFAAEVLGVVALDGATGHERWHVPLGSPPQNFAAEPRGLTVDGAGNALVSMTVALGEFAREMTVVKLAAADGTKMWRIDRDGPAPDTSPYRRHYRHDASGQIAERDGRIAVVGSLVFRDTHEDGIALLLTPSGEEVWRAVSLSPAYDAAYAAALLPGGDVVAAGSLQVAGGQNDIVVTRLADETGDVVWKRALARGRAIGVRALGVDPGGDVLTAIDRDDRDHPVVLTKLAAADGTPVWSVALHRKERDGALGVAFTRDGDVVVAVARDRNPNAVSTRVRRFSSADGKRKWSKAVSGISFAGLAVDGDGNVVVHGFGTSFFRGVAKLDGATGAKVWQVETESVDALTTDSRGDVLIGGQVLVPPPATTMAAVWKLDGATGTELWRELLGGELDFGYGVRVAVTPADDVLATATVSKDAYAPSGATGPAQPFAAKIAGAIGTRTWLREFSVGSDYAYGCAVSALASDRDGNMLLGGCVAPFKASTVTAFSVSRLAADDGTLAWRRTIPGSPVPFVNALTVDESGQVVAAGSTTTPTSGADFTVVKWRPR